MKAKSANNWRKSKDETEAEMIESWRTKLIWSRDGLIITTFPKRVFLPTPKTAGTLFSCLNWFRCWGGKLRLCHLWTSFTICEEASFIITFLRRKTILEAWHFFSTTFVSMGIVKKVMEENRVSAFLYPAQHKPHGCEETGCWAEGLSPSFNSGSNRRQQEMQRYIIFSVRDSGNYIYGESGEEAGHSIPNFLQIFDLRERKGSAFRSGPCFSKCWC